MEGVLTQINRLASTADEVGRKKLQLALRDAQFAWKRRMILLCGLLVWFVHCPYVFSFPGHVSDSLPRQAMQTWLIRSFPAPPNIPHPCGRESQPLHYTGFKFSAIEHGRVHCKVGSFA